MKLADWYKAALASGKYKRKGWILNVFSIQANTTDIRIKARTPEWEIMYEYPDEADPVTGLIMPIAVTFTDHNAQQVHIEDYTFNPKKPAPPLAVGDTIMVEPGEVVTVKSKTKTTAGTLLANYLLCIYPFGDKLGYYNGRFSIADVEKDISSRLKSDAPDNEATNAMPKGDGDKGDPNEKDLYVKELIKFTRAAGMISGLSALCVPSATRKSLTTHPDMDKTKKKLLEENKDRLHDPVVVSEIDKKLVELDTKWLEGDDANGFLIGGKSRNVIRKKTFGMVGYNNAFADITDTKPSTVPYSFREGLDIKHMPAVISDSRASSHDRGADTALGGDEVKKILAVMQNTKVSPGDCGTKVTYPMEVTKESSSQILDTWIVDKGKLVYLDKGNIDNYMGTTVNLRSPLNCKEGNNNICSVCVGGIYAKYPNSLPTAMANYGTTFQDIFMSSMHAKGLATSKYDKMKHII